MATSTLTAIRREAADRLDGTYLQSAVTGGSSTTVIDTVRLRESTRSTYDYEGSWIYFPAGTISGAANIRDVSDYAPSTGTLTVANAWGGTPANAQEFELHGIVHPTDWNTAINRGLRRCINLKRYAITIVDSQLQYSLASAITTLESAQQAKRLLERRGATSGQYEWYEVPQGLWEVYEDDDTYTLNLKRAYTSAANLALYLECYTPYASLATESATTTCPLDWAVSAALQCVYEKYGTQIESHAQSKMKAAQVTDMFTQQSAIWSPQVSYEMALPGF
jgi:hypothetical protein